MSTPKISNLHKTAQDLLRYEVSERLDAYVELLVEGATVDEYDELFDTVSTAVEEELDFEVAQGRLTQRQRDKAADALEMDQAYLMDDVFGELIEVVWKGDQLTVTYL